MLYNQLHHTLRKKISEYQTGFRKDFNPQNCLADQKLFGSRGKYAVLLTYLSKVFDCLPFNLIIAKLHTYGFDMPSLTRETPKLPS